jgi:hypothetical protein
MKNIGKLAAGGGALLAVLALAGAAQATEDGVIPGTGYAAFASGHKGVGNSGVDAFGNAWTWGTTLGKVTRGVPKGWSTWGTPGLGDGEAVYKSHTPAVDFEITFLEPIATLGAISEIKSPGPGGYNETTRFDACAETCVEWKPVYIGDDQVDFFAPLGTELVNGEHYFVNVVFDNGKLSGVNSGFSAAFTGVVPEISTWAMMLLGIGTIGANLRHRRLATKAA